MSDSLQPHGLHSPWNSPGQNTGVGSLSLPQGISPTQGSNPGLPYCRQILYQLNHKGSPRILEWVAYPFSRDLPDPGIELGSPALQADSSPTELSGKPSIYKQVVKTTFSDAVFQICTGSFMFIFLQEKPLLTFQVNLMSRNDTCIYPFSNS